MNSVEIGVGAFILDKDNRLLLMRRGPKARTEQGYWALPGGKVDPGETPEETTIRETLEETGLSIRIEKELAFYNCSFPEETPRWMTHVYLARATGGEAKIMEPDKCDALEWYSLDALPAPIARMSQPAIDRYLARD